MAILVYFAVGKLVLHLPFHGQYGFHHDEYYFLACGEHLSFGYVDHAPLVPWIARLATTPQKDLADLAVKFDPTAGQ